ncbi:DUF1839 family protein [Agrobacterium rubi]|uniref:DUF1839 family protein n=1 Tax=Agrobacterium rubi TaxID=28099 RepID=A0AAE7R2M0_9HYPH|nr:DUF1839 family protein [Agrobacterium rubi]NTE87330.1 DUF1839 family protein [Agrobacterium rubi]NTF03639.1 DUF1839 family protein [Agrobacterium rubi]NTF37798.1 DUF1839 family protein [Agrobacterium rubi]OCJ45532.1 serine--tRNA ligase [Agrobacterium rubi]QTG00044.1 DUF1839 family protein [Agrobacterium rubi]
MTSIFPALNAETYVPHSLHSLERMWPETNCYVDLWIELLAASGLPPEAMLGFTLTQDFEGDQFTFFKVPLEDLETLYGIRVSELAIFDRLENHIQTQLQRGRICLIEMDSFYMPDTHGTAYRKEHGKTTVAINRMDVENRKLEYFHNGGYFALDGDDFSGIFQHHLTDDDLPFLPYTEFAKFSDKPVSETERRAAAERLLVQHFAIRPTHNPIQAFAEVFPAQVETVADRPFGFFHKYAFNTLRQFGANFELAASHLEWLGGANRFGQASAHALRISEVAKSVQFQLARAIARRKFEPLATALDPAIVAWDEMMAELDNRLSKTSEAA